MTVESLHVRTTGNRDSASSSSSSWKASGISAMLYPLMRTAWGYGSGLRLAREASGDYSPGRLETHAGHQTVSIKSAEVSAEVNG